jgi:hypothetical protein
MAGTIARWGALALLSLILLAACSGSTVETTFTVLPQATTSVTATATSTATATPQPTDSPLDASAPLDATYTTEIFDPAFSLQIPSDWVAVERDAAAFQAYVGNEDYELTVDSTYMGSESVEDAIERLISTPRLDAGEVTAMTVGGRDGLFFVADPSGAVAFPDSGFHTNRPAHLRVGAVSVAGGKTVTIFIVTPHSDFAELDEIALRILATLEWIPAS